MPMAKDILRVILFLQVAEAIEIVTEQLARMDIMSC